MLPTATDNGGRLAAIMPTGLAALALGHDRPALPELLSTLQCGDEIPSELTTAVSLLPRLKSLVVVAVDGLGAANLKARRGHAPTLSSLGQRRITTVTPSTTAAALTTLTTGTLPGEHGFVGYRIRHPRLGVLSPLRDWTGVGDPRTWQLSTPLFERAASLGVTARSYGRPAHRLSGLTNAILSDAEYTGGDTIAERFEHAKGHLVSGESTLAYVYVDELDRAGHQFGWQSQEWSNRLEQFDRAFSDFVTGLPAGTGVVVTADHGMVDIEPHQQIIFDLSAPEFADVAEVAGEPRFRTFFLREGADSAAFAAMLEATEAKRAWVATREEVFASGVFGDRVAPGVPERIGDVVLAARGQVAYYSTADDEQALKMVGQHGSWTDEERGIPLILAGALSGSGFGKAIELVASARG